MVSLYIVNFHPWRAGQERNSRDKREIAVFTDHQPCVLEFLSFTGTKSFFQSQYSGSITAAELRIFIPTVFSSCVERPVPEWPTCCESALRRPS